VIGRGSLKKEDQSVFEGTPRRYGKHWRAKSPMLNLGGEMHVVRLIFVEREKGRKRTAKRKKEEGDQTRAAKNLGGKTPGAGQSDAKRHSCDRGGKGPTSGAG